MPWYYYNENNEKIGPVRSRELKNLVEQGTVTPETKVEDGEGRTALAKSVTGLTFAETAHSKVEDLDEQDFARLREDIGRLQNQQEKQQPVPKAKASSVSSPAPAGPNPFSVPVPGAVPAGANPFSASIPPVRPPSRTFGEIMAATMKATMDFLASTIGFIVVLILMVFVVWMLYSLLVLAELAPAPPIGSWIEQWLMFGNPARVVSIEEDNDDGAPQVVPENGNGQAPGAVNGEIPDMGQRPEEIGVREFAMPIPNNNADAGIPEGWGGRGGNRAGQGIAERRQADVQRRTELIADAVPISTDIITARFGGNDSGNGAMRNLANFGTSALRDEYNRTYGIWNKASPFDKEKTRANLEAVRTRIENYTRTHITPKTYWGDWAYSVSDLVVGGNESHFVMTIVTGFNPLQYRSLAIGDTELRFPQGITATVSEFGSRHLSGDTTIRILVNGDTDAIRELYENRGNYRVRVTFTNFRSIAATSRASTTLSSMTPTSAEVLRIAIGQR